MIVPFVLLLTYLITPMLLRFTLPFSTFLLFVSVSLMATTVEAQGYFRLVQPVADEHRPLSATLLPLSINTDNKDHVVLPTPRPLSSEQKIDALFRRGTARAIIAWNGKLCEDGESLLILSSDLISATGQNEAVLGILPLPGKPTSIERIPDDVFQRAKNIMDTKIAEIMGPPEGHVVPGPIVYPPCVTPSVFVLAFNDIEHFVADVHYFARTIFDSSVHVVIDAEAMGSVTRYWERGFRHFAFEVSHLGRQPLHKTAIAYRFQSPYAYYPLAVGAIGGTGHGLIDIIVITPGSINLGGAFEQGKEEAPILVKGNTAVDLTMDEIRELDPRLEDIFKSDELDTVRVRNFLIEAENIGGFKDDFIGVNTTLPSAPEGKLPSDTGNLE